MNKKQPKNYQKKRGTFASVTVLLLSAHVVVKF